MEDMKINETVINDVVQEKDKEKVETKSSTSKRSKPSSSVKECDVLVYNKKNNTIIISFDGFGYELKGITKDPGKKVLVKYSGDVHSPNFKIEIKK